jgi:hypothetical protein
MAGPPWTEEDAALAQAMRARGARWSVIALRVRRSIEAVRTEGHRRGWRVYAAHEALPPVPWPLARGIPSPTDAAMIVKLRELVPVIERDARLCAEVVNLARQALGLPPVHLT